MTSFRVINIKRHNETFSKKNVTFNIQIFSEKDLSLALFYNSFVTAYITVYVNTLEVFKFLLRPIPDPTTTETKNGCTKKEVIGQW